MRVDEPPCEVLEEHLRRARVLRDHGDERHVPRVLVGHGPSAGVLEDRDLEPPVAPAADLEYQLPNPLHELEGGVLAGGHGVGDEVGELLVGEALVAEELGGLGEVLHEEGRREHSDVARGDLGHRRHHPLGEDLAELEVVGPLLVLAGHHHGLLALEADQPHALAGLRVQDGEDHACQELLLGGHGGIALPETLPAPLLLGGPAPPEGLPAPLLLGGPAPPEGLPAPLLLGGPALIEMRRNLGDGGFHPVWGRSVRHLPEHEPDGAPADLAQEGAEVTERALWDLGEVPGGLGHPAGVTGEADGRAVLPHVVLVGTGELDEVELHHGLGEGRDVLLRGDGVLEVHHEARMGAPCWQDPVHEENALHRNDPPVDDRAPDDAGPLLEHGLEGELLRAHYQLPVLLHVRGHAVGVLGRRAALLNPVRHAVAVDWVFPPLAVRDRGGKARATAFLVHLVHEVDEVHGVLHLVRSVRDGLLEELEGLGAVGVHHVPDQNLVRAILLLLLPEPGDAPGVLGHPGHEGVELVRGTRQPPEGGDAVHAIHQALEHRVRSLPRDDVDLGLDHSLVEHREDLSDLLVIADAAVDLFRRDVPTRRGEARRTPE
mmetsp:Transcript_37357/g.117549  ORF Transcript_37357/g.117549 Transcript_37357/m.117549 type:complete len:603 (-) Transcript_37357:2050-3858(-)